ncbi:PREDICTED: phospholipase D delta-like [Populus euphratica]|uniref:Phospholipase D n=1 Tax=Populus euphratica TaxID=75702 RepID=A0AAJ6X6U4_POPEU|nr:PREDICTED: phospholipase D delta-like [Populus euphratica]
MAENSSHKQHIYLHGDLDLFIVQARSLPNMDVISKNIRQCFGVCTPSSTSTTSTTKSIDHPHHHPSDAAKKIRHHRRIITSDAYVTVTVPQVTLARTRVLKNATSPIWEQRFNIPLAHPVKDIEFHVKDNDLFGAELIGTANIPASTVALGEDIKGWFPIIAPSGKPPKPDTALYLEMKFIPFEKNPLYRNGFGGDPEVKGVRRTYFPVRKGGHVTLYQDAHGKDHDLPEIEIDGGKVYKQEKCWEDICYAISEAHHMIYIVGWSVFYKIKLVREPTRPLPRGGDLTLGELLRYKSEEGVRVLLLVWDDRTSHDKFGIETAGVMATHDEETRRFFKHSSVTCVLAPRYASSKLSFLKQQTVGTIFTHHQKCVIVDTQACGNNRKITAFIGGIDLCDGRYDTPEHRLFHDLNTVFKDDFHNPTFTAGTKAPRQPWHDLHCKIDGPAAYDVLINFEQRWRKATKWTELGLHFKRTSHWSDDSLIKIERISWILSPPLSKTKAGTTTVPGDDPTVFVSSEEDPDHWHVQIFRSIDSGSLKGFPKTIDDCQAQNLVVAKDLVVDKSIQTAYIQAIRSAQHFIYIENQYFLGSSYAWPSYKDAGADNLIPMELALKIASKIRAKERFAVYVVIPLWPEGDPKTNTVQEILFWQSQTMQAMYEKIAQELKSMDLVDSHPLDYLNFYCIGKREEIPQELSSDNGGLISEAFKSQRFMIYVHAKGMIVDDEYVIVGSANINQRSMAGSKDTEIAMGSYQPHHTWGTKKKHPRGQVYGYRMSLWREHLGEVDELFMEPENLLCVKRVNHTAEENWKKFTDPNFKLLKGHLLKYPLKVDADGKVGPLPGSENFPDVGGKVLGAHSATIPDALTT